MLTSLCRWAGCPKRQVLNSNSSSVWVTDEEKISLSSVAKLHKRVEVGRLYSVLSLYLIPGIRLDALPNNSGLEVRAPVTV